MSDIDASPRGAEKHPSPFKELGNHLVPMMVEIDHQSLVGPQQIKRSLDMAAHSSPETKKATDSLIDPLLHPSHLADYLTGNGDNPNQRIKEVQQALHQLSQHPEQADEVMKSFNQVMNQYGVSLEKEGDNFVLKSNDQNEKASLTFDKSGNFQSSETTTSAKDFPDFTVKSDDGESAADAFRMIQGTALGEATDIADKCGQPN